MGGKKSPFKAVASDLVGATTAGIVDVNNGKINTKGGDIAANWGDSVSGGDTIKSFSPEAPELPVAEDPAAQAAKAKAESDKKVMDEVGLKGKGLSSTLVGGSLSEDDTILKKRKLLGA